MSKIRKGVYIATGLIASFFLITILTIKMFPDIGVHQMTGYLLVVGWFHLFALLLIVTVFLILGGRGEATNTIETPEKETEAKAQETRMTEDEKLKEELRQLQKKYGLSDKELAVWREAEKQRRENPKGRSLDL